MYMIHIYDKVGSSWHISKVSTYNIVYCSEICEVLCFITNFTLFVLYNFGTLYWFFYIKWQLKFINQIINIIN